MRMPPWMMMPMNGWGKIKFVFAGEMIPGVCGRLSATTFGPNKVTGHDAKRFSLELSHIVWIVISGGWHVSHYRLGSTALFRINRQSVDWVKGYLEIEILKRKHLQAAELWKSLYFLGALVGVRTIKQWVQTCSGFMRLVASQLQTTWSSTCLESAEEMSYCHTDMNP
jgi:hypothetical protein